MNTLYDTTRDLHHRCEADLVGGGRVLASTMGGKI